MHLAMKHAHMPHTHGAFVWMNQMVHNESFWAWVAILTVMATLVALGLWASMVGTSGPVMPMRYFPY
jgi:hypothetical protein